MYILEIIIAKNSVNIQSDINLESLKIGDELKIELIGKKFELGEKKMLGIGRVVKDISNKDINKNIENEQYVEQDEDDIYDIKSNSDDEDEDKDDNEDNEEDKDDDDDDENKNGGSDFFSDEENFFSDEDQEIEEIDDDLVSIKSSEESIIDEDL